MKHVALAYVLLGLVHLALNLWTSRHMHRRILRDIGWRPILLNPKTYAVVGLAVLAWLPIFLVAIFPRALRRVCLWAFNADVDELDFEPEDHEDPEDPEEPKEPPEGPQEEPPTSETEKK